MTSYLLISQLRLLDVSAQLKRSAHAAFDLAINYVQANGRTGLFFQALKVTSHVATPEAECAVHDRLPC